MQIFNKIILIAGVTMLARIIRPLSKGGAYLLEKVEIEPEQTFLLSLLTTAIALLSFYISLVIFPGSKLFFLTGLAFLFLSLLIHESLNEILAIYRREGNLRFLLDRYMDIPVIGGLVAIFLLDNPFITLGNVTFLSSYLYYLFGGFVLGIGLLEWSKGERFKAQPGDWMDNRSTRLLTVFAFLVYGYTQGTILEAFFLSFILLVALLYLQLLISLFAGMDFKIRAKLKIWWHSAIISFKNAFISIGFGLVSSVIKKISGLKYRLKRPRVPSGREEVEEEPLTDDEEPEEDFKGFNFTVVITDRGNVPMPDVSVILHHKESALEESKQTDDSGRCDFKNVASGGYRIIIQGGGAKTESHDRYINMDYGELFQVDKSTTDLSVVVSRKGSTAPIPEALVELEAPEENLYFSQKTNNLGVAYFRDLDVMDYKMKVSVGKFKTYSRAVSLQAENVISVGLEKEADSLPEKRESREGKKAEVKTSKEHEKELPEEKEGVETPVEKSPTEFIGEAALIEYGRGISIEGYVISIIREHLEQERDVFLVSAMPGTNHYRREFESEAELGSVKIINLPTGSSAPIKNRYITEIPIKKLDRFKKIYDAMPAGSLFVFEPFTGLIKKEGLPKARAFVYTSIKTLSPEGLLMVAFLERDDLNTREIADIRSLFSNVAEITEKGLKRIK